MSTPSDTPGSDEAGSAGQERPAPDEYAGREHSAPPAPDEYAGRERKRCGLAVIADPEFRKEVGESAGEEGFALAEAGSVEEALANWGGEVGVVLLDASLAGEAGPLLDRAREAGVPVRVAARPDQVDEVLGLLKSGARGFLALPQPPEAVLEEMKRALAREAERHLEDTTGIGRAKKELQAVFDTFPSALLVVDPDLRIRRANRATLSLPGKGVLPNPIGSDVRDMLGRVAAPGRRRLAEAVRGSRSTGFDLEVLSDSKTGRFTRTYHLRVFPGEAGRTGSDPGAFPAGMGEAGADGLGDGALVLVEDVTLSRREEAEHAHKQQLEAVTLLSATLSHEINQPLGTILGRAQLSLMCLEQEGLDKAPLKRDLEEVVRCVRRVSEILDKLHRVADIVRKPYLGDTEILDLERSAGPFGRRPTP